RDRLDDVEVGDRVELEAANGARRQKPADPDLGHRVGGVARQPSLALSLIPRRLKQWEDRSRRVEQALGWRLDHCHGVPPPRRAWTLSRIIARSGLFAAEVDWIPALRSRCSAHRIGDPTRPPLVRGGTPPAMLTRITGRSSQGGLILRHRLHWRRLTGIH